MASAAAGALAAAAGQQRHDTAAGSAMPGFTIMA